MRPVRQSRFGMRFWSLAVIAAALVLLMGATAKVGAFVVPSAVVNAGIAPVEVVATQVAGGVSGFYHGIAALWSLRSENAQLRAENAALKAGVLQDAELRAENANLNALVHLQTSTAGSQLGRTIAANVIGRSPDSWFASLVVDKGSAAGVVPGMTVITPDGLVGRIMPGVSAATARVMLVTNPDFGVGIVVQRQDSREEGVAQGELGSPNLTATFFSATANVHAGDELVTSGLNGGFPRGLAVGSVSKVMQGDFGLVRQAEVVPAAHLESVEDVLLLPVSGNGVGG